MIVPNLLSDVSRVMLSPTVTPIDNKQPFSSALTPGISSVLVLGVQSMTSLPPASKVPAAWSTAHSALQPQGLGPLGSSSDWVEKVASQTNTLLGNTPHFATRSLEHQSNQAQPEHEQFQKWLSQSRVEPPSYQRAPSYTVNQPLGHYTQHLTHEALSGGERFRSHNNSITKPTTMMDVLLHGKGEQRRQEQMQHLQTLNPTLDAFVTQRAMFELYKANRKTQEKTTGHFLSGVDTAGTFATTTSDRHLRRIE